MRHVTVASISRVAAWTFLIDQGRLVLKKAVDAYNFDPQEFLVSVEVKHNFSPSTLQREGLIGDGLPSFDIIG